MIDPAAPAGVLHRVKTFRVFGALLLAGGLAACQSKAQGNAQAGGTTAANGQPAGGGGAAAGGAGGATGGGAPGTGGTVDQGSTSPGSDSPGVKPPGLDLTPEEKKSQVGSHLRKAQTAVDAGDPDLAINEAKAALAVDETSIDAMVILAQAQFAKGYFDQVEDVLTKALERGGAQNKKLHFIMGLVHDRNKKPDQALESYSKAVAIDASYDPAVMNLGVHLLRTKRYGEAVSLYERLTGELNYRTAAAFTNLGSAYRGQSAEFTTSDVGRRNDLLLKAQTAYRRGLAIDKNYANATYNLGLLFLDADPFPDGKDDMDLLKRLRQAKAFFDEYRRLPSADQKLADEQVAVAQKLIDKEERARAKAAEVEAKRKAREAKDKAREAKEKAGGGNP